MNVGIPRWAAPVTVALGAVALAAGCGGDEGPNVVEPGPPVGQPVLPDLVPSPPRKVHLRGINGRWTLSFDSILVNVGDGEFLLRAKREGDGGNWHVKQDIPYSTSGAKPVGLRASLVWGGDGHEHWHVPRVATNRLERLDGEGRPVPGLSWSDAKVGFCFFDYSRQLRKKGPDEAVHSRHSCGHEDDDLIGMGLSPGWGDTYTWVLPGQSIDITDLPDGKYRLWAEADRRRWFREVTRDNNRTWVDFDLSTNADRVRFAQITKVGPRPRANDATGA